MNMWGVAIVSRPGRARVAVLVSSALLVGGLAGTGAGADLPLPACTSQLPPAVSAPNGATMLFDDEFAAPNGTKACPSKWNYEMGGQWNNGEQQGYSTNQSFAQIDNDGSGNGYLSINAKPYTYHDPVADALGQNPAYTSARLDTYGSFQFTYGHVEARIWAAGGQTWPAFWLLGPACAPTYNGKHPAWPTCGEIDIMELSAGQPTVEYATVHQPKVDTSGVASAPVASLKEEWTSGRAYDTGVNLTAGWHRYAADIRDNSITFSFDGQPFKTVCGRLDNMTDGGTPNGKIWGADHPWYIVMNVAVPPPGSGVFQGGPTDPSTFGIQSMRVDYVRVWTDPSYAEAAAC